jgi:hypothetical protein
VALFGFGRPRPGQAQRRAIEAWAREAGGYGDEVAMTVSEIVCPDPACPGFETVILVMVPGDRAVARKIARPLAEVTRDDVAAAVRACS